MSRESLRVDRGVSRMWALPLLIGVLALPGQPANAHGERNQEPWLRMRTTHYYDVNFSVPEESTVRVNDEITLTGKVRLFGVWPETIAKPGKMYLNALTAGAAFAKKESWVNGVAAVQSFVGEAGRDYAFKLVLQARVPGRWHVHPMFNVEDASGLAGPGVYINIEGSLDDFLFPVTTIDGTHIANLADYGIGNVVAWHTFWVVLALAWILWWIRRPVLLPRFLMRAAGDYEDVLVNRQDRIIGGILLVVVVGVVVGGYYSAEGKYPRTIPLQTGTAHVVPLDQTAGVSVRVEAAKYFVPGRTVLADIRVTNSTDSPIRLGEFTTANLRFVNMNLPSAVAGISSNFPKEFLARVGLQINDDTPIAPGETRVVSIDASDAAWETERLAALLTDPDSSLGGLLFFFDETGKRYITELFGPLVPVFTQ